MEQPVARTASRLDLPFSSATTLKIQNFMCYSRMILTWRGMALKLQRIILVDHIKTGQKVFC